MRNEPRVCCVDEKCTANARNECISCGQPMCDGHADGHLHRIKRQRGWWNTGFVCLLCIGGEDITPVRSCYGQTITLKQTRPRLEALVKSVERPAFTLEEALDIMHRVEAAVARE